MVTPMIGWTILRVFEIIYCSNPNLQINGKSVENGKGSALLNGNKKSPNFKFRDETFRGKERPMKLNKKVTTLDIIYEERQK